VNTPRLTPAIEAGILDLPTPEGWKAELTGFDTEIIYLTEK